MTSIKLKRSILSTLLLGSALGLASCASGPTYAEASKTFPPIPKGKGRVFIYRDSSFGAMVKPDIKIDDQSIGKSYANGFRYSDQSPGQHVISLTTEWKHKETFTVTAGQPTFIGTHVTPGAFVGHVIPTVETRAEGEKAIQNCKHDTE